MMRVLGMFARRPEPGKTKTRLAASLGNELAAELYGEFVGDLLARIPQLSDRFHLAVTPASAMEDDWFIERAPESALILAQPDVDLGARIEWFFQTAAEQGGTRCVLIGSDSPDLPCSYITAAFTALDDADLVVSPASDGGYVLIGLNKPVPGLFDDIPWSSAATLTATVSRAQQLGLTARLLPPWYDIDTIHNLGALIPMQESSDIDRASCPRTMRKIKEHAETIREQLRQH